MAQRPNQDLRAKQKTPQAQAQALYDQLAGKSVKDATILLNREVHGLSAETKKELYKKLGGTKTIRNADLLDATYFVNKFSKHKAQAIARAIIDKNGKSFKRLIIEEIKKTGKLAVLPHDFLPQTPSRAHLVEGCQILGQAKAEQIKREYQTIMADIARIPTSRDTKTILLSDVADKARTLGIKPESLQAILERRHRFQVTTKVPQAKTPQQIAEDFMKTNPIGVKEEIQAMIKANRGNPSNLNAPQEIAKALLDALKGPKKTFKLGQLGGVKKYLEGIANPSPEKRSAHFGEEGSEANDSKPAEIDVERDEIHGRDFDDYLVQTYNDPTFSALFTADKLKISLVLGNKLKWENDEDDFSFDDLETILKEYLESDEEERGSKATDEMAYNRAAKQGIMEYFGINDLFTETPAESNKFVLKESGIDAKKLMGVRVRIFNSLPKPAYASVLAELLTDPDSASNEFFQHLQVHHGQDYMIDFILEHGGYKEMKALNTWHQQQSNQNKQLAAAIETRGDSLKSQEFLSVLPIAMGSNEGAQMAFSDEFEAKGGKSMLQAAYEYYDKPYEICTTGSGSDAENNAAIIVKLMEHDDDTLDPDIKVCLQEIQAGVVAKTIPCTEAVEGQLRAHMNPSQAPGLRR